MGQLGFIFDPRLGKARQAANYPNDSVDESCSDIDRNRRDNCEHYVPKRVGDLPPLKWSSLKYVLNTEDWINGEEETYG